MARKPAVDEKSLPKMVLRKLNALKRSIGDELGARVFAEWLKEKPRPSVEAPADRTAAAIAGAVERLIADGRIKSLPRGGYVVKRGRGRVIVEPAAAR
jgi:hypothetical protein